MSSLQLYVAYDEYLTVDQLSDLLRSADQLYEALYYVEVPDAAPAGHPPTTSLRLGHAETGNSITVSRPYCSRYACACTSSIFFATPYGALVSSG